MCELADQEPLSPSVRRAKLSLHATSSSRSDCDGSKPGLSTACIINETICYLHAINLDTLTILQFDGPSVLNLAYRRRG